MLVGKNPEGHYKLKVRLDVGRGATIEEDLLLGSWFLKEAKLGYLRSIPVAQAV